MKEIEKTLKKEMKEIEKILKIEFDEERIIESINHAHELTWFEKEDIDLMRKDENYKCYPNLALSMFHCSGANPKVHACNNESLLNDTTGEEERISNEMEDKLSHDEVLQLIEDVKESNLKNKPLWACASCNEMILSSNASLKVKHVKVSEIHENFKVSQDEISNLMQKYGNNNAIKHFSLFKASNRDWFYLNPDLIVNEDSITLCSRCYKAPCSCNYSLASGYNCRVLGDLSEINLVIKNKHMVIML